jgi:hypothetical protein
VFIEYAAGLEPADFTRFFSSILDLTRISACVDIGHVGVRAARTAYARQHPGEDVCALKSRPANLPKLIHEIDSAVAAGAAATFELVEAVCALKRPLHFHLHDAHPLSTSSPYGLSDHLSFFAKIPINFEHRGRRTLAPMFGPEGLSKLIARMLQLTGSRPASFTLEIHPTGERLPLDDATAGLFEHWNDKAHAEQMNHWLSVLGRNHLLLTQVIHPVAPPDPGPAGSVDPESQCPI